MDAKDEVKSRLSVEDVVGEYLELKPSGRNLKALSPFSSEKTPSFMVSPEKQIWHDFSSNQGGDIFSFVMLMEGIDFKEALELLARKAGVEITQHRGDGQGAKRKARAQAALNMATQYYFQTLVKNKSALTYLRTQRAFSKQTITDWQLGYAPTTGSSLTQFLLKKKFTEAELNDAGLAVRRHGQLMDMFRGRIMVPLADGQGQTVGFTARILPELDNGTGPKYINTPQTVLYDKSRHVFGLHHAKDAIRKSDSAVLTEGNLDVIASHQAGVKQVVATAGTAMTREQLKQLMYLSRNIKLAFDSDAAGLAATLRAIPIVQELDLHLDIIPLEGGKDPDELIQQDPKLWVNALEKSQYVLDWVVAFYKQQFDVASADGKRQFTDAVLKVIKAIHDPVEQEHYLKYVAETIDSSLPAVQAKFKQMHIKDKPKLKKAVKVGPKDFKPDNSAYQDTLLALNILYPETRQAVRNVVRTMFQGELRQQVFDYIAGLSTRDIVKGVPPELSPIADYVKILLLKAEELYGSWTESDRSVEAVGLTRRLKEDDIKDQKQIITDAIRQAEESGDTNRAQKLLKNYQALLKEE